MKNKNMGVEDLYFLNVLYMIASQSIVIYIVGIPLVKAIQKVPALTKKN